MFLSTRCISMLLLSISCCFASLQADFVDLQVWRRTTPSGEKQHLVCCGDKHNLGLKADEQSDDLIEFLNRRGNQHDVVLIEDWCDFSYIIEQAQAYLKENGGRDESCLQGIQTRYDEEVLYGEHLFECIKGKPIFPALLKFGQKIANERNTSLINLDFRHLMDHRAKYVTFSWEECLDGLDDYVHRSIVKEIQEYDDNELLNTYYANCVSPYLCMKRDGWQLSFEGVQRALLRNKFKPSMRDYLPFPDSKYYDSFKLSPAGPTIYNSDDYAFALSSELLDARLLHHIYQKQVKHQQSNLLCACFGQGHFENIDNMLPKLGYRRIGNDDKILQKSLKDSLHSVFSKESDLNKLQAKL